jgi:hypothetical protein
LLLLADFILVAPRGKDGQWRMGSPRYSWQSAYEDAITVRNPEALKSKIYQALAAFEQRRSAPVDAEECQALADAEQVLKMLHDESRVEANDRGFRPVCCLRGSRQW